MPAPSVTYTFTNGTTSDATQVNTNFTDILNCLSDGTCDLSVGTVTVAGAVTFNGAVTLGNATADDLTFNGNLASHITLKANATYNIGAANVGLLSIYLGNGTKSTRIMAGTVGTSWTFTLPNDAPTITGQTMVFDTNGTASFRYPDKFTASKTTTYVATGDETVIPCDATAASFTVTLPAASSCPGKEFTIIKTDADITKLVTIDGNGSDTILPSVQSSNLTYILYTQYESVSLKSDGVSAWYVTQHFAETPWTTYTPTTTGLGTVSAVSFFYKRSRDMVHVKGRLNSGTPTAATVVVSLPGSSTLNSAKLPTPAQCAVLGTCFGNIDTAATALPTTSRGAWVVTNKNGDDTGVMLSDTIDKDATATDTVFGATLGNAMSTLNRAVVVDFIAPVLGWNP
jgi:hypothetical protein